MEHENAVDYEGHGFLRRSGLADVDPIEGHIGTDTPAEPTHERYRHGQPNPDSYSTMRVRNRLPMSVCIYRSFECNRI